MAFLGGLMSGTTGAFIRGSLDTATDIIQSNAARDEEGIQDRVKGFGAKKKVYDDGINAFKDETQKIDSIAQLLAVQDDEMLQGASEDELKGIARGLMQYDSKNPLDFFLKNRDKFTVKPIKTTTETPAQSPDMAQTDAVLATTEEPAEAPSGFAATMGRLFGGAGEEELEQRTARKLGISVEQYRTILANNTPTRSEPTVALALDAPDKHKKLIEGRQKTVSGIITKPEFLRMENVELPNGKKVSGQAITAAIIKGYEDYELGRGGAEELMQLQRFALTLAMPKDVKGLFKDLHGPSITTIDKNVGNTLIPQEQRDRLQIISQELDKHMIEAQTTESYSTENAGKNMQAVSALVIEGMNIVGASAKTDGKGSYVTNLRKRLDDNLSAIRTNPDRYDAATRNLLPELHAQITIAVNENKPEMLAAVETALAEVRVLIPETTSVGTKEQEAQNLADYMIKNGGFTGTPEEALRKARYHLSTGVVMIQGMPHREEFIDGRFQQVEQDIAKLITTEVQETPDGPTVQQQSFVPIAPYKVRKENRKTIKSNVNAIMDLGETEVMLAQFPNAYNYIGTFIKKGGNVIEGLGDAAGFDIDTGVADYATMQQRVIPLISSAKDRLFQDPRLSDRDLKIVLDYVGLIRADGEFGLSKRSSLAALYQLRKAIVADQMLRMAENNRNFKTDVLASDGDVILHDKDGKLKTNTTAGVIAKQMAASLKFTILNKKDYMKIYNKAKESQNRIKNGTVQSGDTAAVAQFKEYQRKMDTIQDTIQYGTQRAQAYIASGYDTKTFRSANKDKSGLATRTDMNVTDAQVQTELASYQTIWDNMPGYESSVPDSGNNY